MCLLFAITFTSCCSISITLHCVFTIVYTSMAWCTFNCTFVDNYSSFATMLSSLASFYIIYASTKCYSLALSSFDSSMHTKSVDVALDHVCSFTCQCHLLLRKNSTLDVPVIYVLNYCVRKLYLFIICLPFYTFQKWWWMRRRPYNQRLNIQHFFSLCSY
jgi:hypothetical protein